MKKAKKVEFGIEIVKPWSNEMYAHNEAVADSVRETVTALWIAAIRNFAKEFDYNDEMLECEFDAASEELKRIQRAVTVYGFGFGYDVNRVAEIVEEEIEDAPFYRLKDIAEELELKLEKGFVGFN
jgi:phage terminase large subunit